MVNRYKDFIKQSIYDNSFFHVYDDLMRQKKEKFESLYSSTLLIDQFKSFSEISQASQLKKLYSSYDLIRKQQASILEEQSLFKKAIQTASLSAGLLSDISSFNSFKRLIENSGASEVMKISATLSATNSSFDKLINTSLILSPGLKSAMAESTFLKASYFPRIDITSVFAHNNGRDYQEILSQLDKLSIKYESYILEDDSKEAESQLINFDYWSFIYFIISILLFFYQLNDSQMMEKRLGNRIDKNTNDIQKQILNAEKLLEKIISENNTAKISGVEYIVKNRNAKVRNLPRAGASIIAEVYPNQLVVLLKQEGKWVEVEYYDWLQMQSVTGWVLKKYLKRVQHLINKAVLDNHDLPVDFVHDLLWEKAQSKSGLTPFEPDNSN